MTGKSMIIAGVLAAALLGAGAPTLAHDTKVKVLHAPDAAKVAVSTNEGGSGVTVVRGSSTFVPRKAVAAGPVAFIDGAQVQLDSLEPVSDWFLDRSGERAVLLHCYTQQAIHFGDGRRVLCDAHKL